MGGLGDGPRRKYKEDGKQSKLDDVLERTLQAHEKSLENSGEAGGDLLDDLLSAVKEGGDGFMLDRIDVKGLVLVSPKD